MLSQQRRIKYWNFFLITSLATLTVLAIIMALQGYFALAMSLIMLPLVALIYTIEQHLKAPLLKVEQLEERLTEIISWKVGSSLEQKSSYIMQINALGAAPSTMNKAELAGINLDGCNLNKTNLHQANLVGASLQGADLSGADMSYADLSGADLSRADLSGADFRHAILSEGLLANARVDGANFRHAELSNADIRGCKFSAEQILRARFFRANELFPLMHVSVDDWIRANVNSKGLFINDITKK